MTRTPPAILSSWHAARQSFALALALKNGTEMSLGSGR